MLFFKEKLNNKSFVQSLQKETHFFKKVSRGSPTGLATAGARARETHELPPWDAKPELCASTEVSGRMGRWPWFE